jgi:hypothetical protein
MCPDCGARLSPAHGNGHDMTHQPAQPDTSRVCNSNPQVADDEPLTISGDTISWGNGHNTARQPTPTVVRVGEACAKCGQPVRYTDATAEGYPGWLRGECGCGQEGVRYVKAASTNKA